MATPETIDRPVPVEARFRSDGHLEPVAFKWQEQIRRIVDRGREWEETSEGRNWRCYLVQTFDRQTFELRFDEAGGCWVLARGWLNERDSNAV